jgi:hypothetical protein
MKKLQVLAGFLMIAYGSLAFGQAAWTAPTLPATGGGGTNAGGGTNWTTGAPIVLGDEFRDLSANATVTYLGIYAGNDTSYTGPEKVQLYDASGNLLTSIVVFKGDSPANGFYWEKVTTPVQLTKGSDYIVAVQVGTNGWGYGPIGSINSWDVFDNSFNNLNSPTSAFPKNLGPTGVQYYGANVWVGPMATTSVPEGGASWLYLLVAAATCLGAFFFTSRTRLVTRA